MRDFSYQLYSSRNTPPLADTLKMLAGLGYAQVEGYGALYSDDAQVEALKAALDETGLTMPTGHFSMAMVENDPQKTIAMAHALGAKAIFIPHLAADERPGDAKGWAEFGKHLAEVAKPYQDAGFHVGWHNHDFEFEATDGDALPIELILAGDDSLRLEFDVAWAQRAGKDPIEWTTRLADRILAAHVKDIAPEGENTDEDGWADVGHGVMDWAAIIGALRETDAEYFVMEHDNPSDHARFARRAIASARTY